jgi:hypothetical protein
MKQLLPGQAALTRLNGKVSLVACGYPDDLPLVRAEFALRGGMHKINIANVLVPAISIVVRVTVGDFVRYYWAWVNELEEGVIETLATQPDLLIEVAIPGTQRSVSSIIPNGVREMAQKYLGIVSRLASEKPWRPQHFAAARVFVEYDYPTAEVEWAALDRATNKDR